MNVTGELIKLDINNEAERYDEMVKDDKTSEIESIESHKTNFMRTIRLNKSAEERFDSIMRTRAGYNMFRFIEREYKDIATCCGGVHTLGYGKLPAKVLADKRMRQPHLLALLGLVCSHAGKDNRAIISRRTACRALKIGQGTFSKYMGLLCDYGYIKRVQPYNHGFGTTEYSVNYDNLAPEKDEWVFLRRTSEAGVSRLVGFETRQYGNIPRFVMYNEQLSVLEKAIYIVLLIAGGMRMAATLRRDFIGELVGIKGVDIISRCTKHICELGFIARIRDYGKKAAGMEYHVLAEMSKEPEVPGSWVKHDFLKVIQTKKYRELLNENEVEGAVRWYLTDWVLGNTNPNRRKPFRGVLQFQNKLKKLLAQAAATAKVLTRSAAYKTMLDEMNSAIEVAPAAAIA